MRTISSNRSATPVVALAATAGSQRAEPRPPPPRDLASGREPSVTAAMMANHGASTAMLPASNLTVVQVGAALEGRQS
jgi:hypothetical protein